MGRGDGMGWGGAQRGGGGGGGGGECDATYLRLGLRREVHLHGHGGGGVLRHLGRGGGRDVSGVLGGHGCWDWQSRGSRDADADAWAARAATEAMRAT